jgi:carbamoyl-phosphate synthase large subunit
LAYRGHIEFIYITMNILFTCAGRRNYLIEYFRDALNHNDRIIAADMQITASSMAVADKAIVVPEVYSYDYLDVILDICHREEINALLSLNDLELPILSSAKRRFDKAGVKLILSDENVIETCFDKYKTTLFCENLNLCFPKTFMSLDQAIDGIKNSAMTFPVVVKPRWGSASVCVEFPETMEELELAYRFVSTKVSKGILYEASKKDLIKSVIIQEKISGTEYGLDILNDFNGRPMQVYIKEKLAMRAGETDKAVLRNKPELEEFGLHIGLALGHTGNLDCDIFENDGVYYLIEMNPRFGGGYPFSHMAGANYPAAICSWLKGHTYDFKNFTKEYDQPFAKCDTLIRVLKE